MLDLKHSSFHTLTKENLDSLVPSRPGIYILAVRLVNDVYQVFFSGQSANLYKSLHRILRQDKNQIDSLVLEYIEKYQCYFKYAAITQPEYREEVEKMLAYSNDPVVRLKVIDSL